MPALKKCLPPPRFHPPPPPVSQKRLGPSCHVSVPARNRTALLSCIALLLLQKWFQVYPQVGIKGGRQKVQSNMTSMMRRVKKGVHATRAGGTARAGVCPCACGWTVCAVFPTAVCAFGGSSGDQ